jgi:hypothetical protein
MDPALVRHDHQRTEGSRLDRESLNIAESPMLTTGTSQAQFFPKQPAPGLFQKISFNHPQRNEFSVFNEISKVVT